MVIGKGLVARRFASYGQENKFLVFASGVSNSKMINPEAYNREITLLKTSIREHKTKSLIYFSTCSIDDPDEKDSVYTRHKRDIENIIRSEVSDYRIFRVSNLAGLSDNPNTVLNFFFYHVQHGINFDLWTRACRNIIDIDTVYLVIDHILQNDLFPKEVINIANPVNYPVKDIVSAIEKFLATRSNYIEIDKGSCFDIDVSLISPVVEKLNIRFGPEYLDDVLHKYYRSLQIKANSE